MDHISRVLPGVLQKRGLAAHAHAALAIHRTRDWLTAHHKTLLPYLIPRSVVDGTLTIEFSHPAAAQESQSHIPALLSFLSEQCPLAAVKAIRLVRSESTRK
ncbi:DUF721 domain-containing protein [Candidatus Peregrinibacteria bacterium]|nr:DUF721 domain-containing protein [Candidatus Peregrinibacteria bacterium]